MSTYALSERFFMRVKNYSIEIKMLLICRGEGNGTVARGKKTLIFLSLSNV